MSEALTTAAAPPVWIIASPRSFTSLVCAMVGQHPAAYGVPELNLMATDTVRELVELASGKRQFLLHGLLRTVAQLYAGEQTVDSVAMARRWLNRRQASSTTDVYRELAQAVAPLAIIDKSPIYTKDARHLERIRAAFPDAFYIYLARHPIDQGRSMMNAPQGVAELLAGESLDFTTSPPTIDPQFEWHDTQVRIRQFLEGIAPHRQLFLRGEAFLREPREHLERICRFLELPLSDEAYQAMLRPEDSPYACMGPFGAQWGNNPGFQKSPAFRAPAGPGEAGPSKAGGTTSLHSALPWRQDTRVLAPAVVQLARSLGYD